MFLAPPQRHLHTQGTFLQNGTAAPALVLVSQANSSWTDVKIVPRPLTEAEYKATLSDHMIDIKGREDEIHPDGVLDLDPYLRAVEANIEPLQLLSDTPPAAVYHSPDGGFDHVLYPINRSNVYLVVVVAPDDDRVHGHYVLDLAREYGLPSDA
jgi:hypothetical protein